jgi:glycosyltransferase involved in cell wall biosynthesis
MKLSFMIPFRASDTFREQIFNWNIVRLEKLFPDAEIVIGESPAGNFNRSAAINDAYKKTSGKYVVLLDADTVWNRSLIMESLTHLQGDECNWLIPYTSYHITNQQSGGTILQDNPARDMRVDDYLYENVLYWKEGDIYPPVSGLNVFTSESFRATGGFDPNFVGWGWEDRAFYFSSIKKIGMPKRLDEPVFHIWHPVGNITGHDHFKENERIFHQYLNNYEVVSKDHLL